MGLQHKNTSIRSKNVKFHKIGRTIEPIAGVLRNLQIAKRKPVLGMEGKNGIFMQRHRTQNTIST